LKSNPLPQISQRGDAVRINIYVQPRASRTEVVGEHGDAIKLRVAAPPVEGEANEEVVRFIAKRLGVSNSAVSLVSGETGRRKIVEVQGITLADAERLLLS
jgi:uncharacterized protein (TIGR00251 family)